MQRVEGGGFETVGLVKRARLVVGGMHQQRPAGHLFVRDEKTLHGVLEQRLAQARALSGLVDGQAHEQGKRNRVPVILQPGDYESWLGAQTKADDLKALLKPLPSGLMEHYRVSRRMSNARNEGEACMASIDVG